MKDIFECNDEMYGIVDAILELGKVLNFNVEIISNEITYGFDDDENCDYQLQSATIKVSCDIDKTNSILYDYIHGFIRSLGFEFKGFAD